jgi:GntR family transcriptional regulator/MocR family aminotransferase
LKACGLARNLHETKPFRPGVPALDLFPAAQFKRCFKSEDWNADFWDYPDPQGYEPLRREIARRLRQTRGVECSADQVFVTSGAQGAFWLLAQTLLNAGETVIVEDPGYPSVRATFAAHRAKIVSAPVDEAGIDVSAFGRRAAKLAYVTPSHQYPTGAVLSLERRFALLEWSQRYGSWILEDDYDSEFNYTGRPQQALYGLSQTARVIYAGTFSKVLAPSLRVSYIVVPHSLRESLRAVQLVSGSYPGTPVQAALARFMQAGLFGRHVTKMRKIYDERRRIAASEFCRHGTFTIHDSRAGLHFIAELPRGVSDAHVSRCAAEAGLIVPALSSYYYGGARRNGLVIGYAATAPVRARRAIAVLRGLV